MKDTVEALKVAGVSPTNQEPFTLYVKEFFYATPDELSNDELSDLITEFADTYLGVCVDEAAIFTNDKPRDDGRTITLISGEDGYTTHMFLTD